MPRAQMMYKPNTAHTSTHACVNALTLVVCVTTVVVTLGCYRWETWAWTLAVSLVAVHQIITGPRAPPAGLSPPQPLFSFPERQSSSPLSSSPPPARAMDSSTLPLPSSRTSQDSGVPSSPAPARRSPRLAQAPTVINVRGKHRRHRPHTIGYLSIRAPSQKVPTKSPTSHADEKCARLVSQVQFSPPPNNYRRRHGRRHLSRCLRPRRWETITAYPCRLPGSGTR